MSEEPQPRRLSAILADIDPKQVRNSESSFRRGYCHGFERALSLFESGTSIERLRQLGDDILDWREDHLRGDGEWGHMPPSVRPIDPKGGA